MEVTLLFPGQGSQYVGMGDTLKDTDDYQLFNKADEALGFKLSEICQNGPQEDLKLTKNTQPAIVTHSLALFEKTKKVLDEKNIKIARVLGHSVGEFAALAAAGVLSFEDAVRAVNSRGQFMQEAVPAGQGKMLALLKINQEVVVETCKAVSNEQQEVMPANFNSPDQIVVSGHATACDDLLAWLEKHYENPYRAIELPVSAPFHCQLMKPAADKLAEFFETITFNKNELPYIANINATEYAVATDGEVIKKNLIEQVCGSVMWTQSFSQLKDGDICLEVGPGKVLFGLARKINRNVKVVPMDSEDAFAKLKELS